MGIGHYVDGKLDLIVSFTFMPTGDQATDWGNCFQEVSDRLRANTNQGMRLGVVAWVDEGAASHDADIYISNADGAAAGAPTHDPNATGYEKYLGKPDLQVTLPADHWQYPSIVHHELMHYLFDLGDEYGDPDADPPKLGCLPSASTGACVMQFATPIGLCTAKDGGLPTDHMSAPGATGGDQQLWHQESCAEGVAKQMEDRYKPPGTLPTDTTINWVKLDDAPRAVLVLDRSGSMGGGPIAGVKDAAHYWLQEWNAKAKVSGGTRRLGIVSYNDDPATVLDLTTLPLNETKLPTELQNILDSPLLTATGLTNIGGGLTFGQQAILSQAPASAAQSMVLLTDGIHNTGQDPDDALIAQLVGNWIRVYTIGYSDAAHEPLLKKIAGQTHAEYQKMDAAAGSAASHAILDGFIKAAGDTSSGFLVHGTYTVGEDPVPVTVPVEPGAQTVTFVVTYLDGAQVELAVTDPGGTPVTPSPTVVRSIASTVPYEFVVVGGQPAAGNWTMTVSAVAGAAPPGNVTISAISGNPAVSVGVTGHEPVYDEGAPIGLVVRAHHDVPLTGMRPPVLRFIDLPDQPEVEAVESPAGSGTYAIRLEEGLPAGRHDAEVLVENDGSATTVVDPVAASHPDLVDASSTEPTATKPFRRVKRIQLHVGPLDPGRDIDPRPAAS